MDQARAVNILVSLINQLVEPSGDLKSELWIFHRLAEKLGFEK
ncbi:MAG: hypothetical protein Kow0019_02090 [Methanobacteriaceae archaeon]